jgi:hypothetical protein
MYGPYETFEHAGLLVKMYQDDYARSPEDWGNEDVFLGALDSRHYSLGRRRARFYRPGDADEDDYDPNGTHYQEGYTAFPVELLDYGSNGLKIRFCDPDDADGAIFVKERTPLEQLVSEMTDEEIAQNVRDIWNSYLSGDVWVICIHERIVTKDEDGEEFEEEGDCLDSCGGFYGYSESVKEAKTMAEAEARHLASKKEEETQHQVEV